jgi:AbrB family looped-hinge helix DNA binding protein
MRVTVKGQVTIPKDIRDRYGIEPGSEVAFVASEKGALMLPVSKLPADDRAAHFDYWADAAKNTLSGGNMTGKEFTDWLRGTRDDIDAG